MKYHLIPGGCGFVGRNLTKRLIDTTSDMIVIVDDLSTGRVPKAWLNIDEKGLIEKGRVVFFDQDIRAFLKDIAEPEHEFYGVQFSDVFQLAAIVGGRSMIDGDPLKIALNLAIDAEFFHWASSHKPERILYPSSSAAYPVAIQTKENNKPLIESDISLETIGLPDMTYGWSKVTGELLAKFAHSHYGLSVACIRPFSGYGEDQEVDYPIPAIGARLARREDPVEVWGTGEQGRDFVHIDDVIDVMLLGLDKIQDGTAINIGSGKLTSFKEIIKTYAEIAGYDPAIKQLLDNPVGTFSRYCDMSFVKDALGWSPKISLKEGLERVYKRALENVD